MAITSKWNKLNDSLGNPAKDVKKGMEALPSVQVFESVLSKVTVIPVPGVYASRLQKLNESKSTVVGDSSDAERVKALGRAKELTEEIIEKTENSITAVQGTALKTSEEADKTDAEVTSSSGHSLY